MLNLPSLISWSWAKKHRPMVLQQVLLIQHHILLRSGYPPPSRAGIIGEDKLWCCLQDPKAAFGIVVRDSTGSLLQVHGNSCFATSALHAEVTAIY